MLHYLQNFKTHAQNLVPMKENEIRTYKNLANFLVKFEQSVDRHVHGQEAELDKEQRVYFKTQLVSAGSEENNLQSRLDLMAQE
jgi:hypothetical protein